MRRPRLSPLTFALAALVAIGVALVAGRVAETSRPPPLAPSVLARMTLPAAEQVDIYAAILTRMAPVAGATPPSTRRPLLVSRTLLDTCPILLPNGCGRPQRVGRIDPAMEASLRTAAARLGLELLFVEDRDTPVDGELMAGHRGLDGWMVRSLHQIVFESADEVAAEGDIQHGDGLRFRFRRVDGRWQLDGDDSLWIA